MPFTRNKQKAGDAAQSIAESSGNKDIHSFAADLSSMAEVRQLAADVQAAFPKINVLSNNAGIFAERMQVQCGSCDFNPTLADPNLKSRQIATLDSAAGSMEEWVNTISMSQG